MSTNTNAQHTPGPWAISRHATPDYAKQYGIYAEESARVADFAIVRGNNADADAALIAAAPQLLEALEEMTSLASGPVGGVSVQMKRDILAKARAAIAKAKGGAA